MTTSRPLATKTKVAFIDYVRPDYHPGIEKRFGVFQWMVRTAHETPRRPGKWGSSGPVELLSMQPSCTGMTNVRSIASVADLDKRFHFALLSRYTSEAANQWRTEHRIEIGQTRWVYFPHRIPWKVGDPCGARTTNPWEPDNIVRARSEHLVVQQVKDLLDASGKTRVQLNPVHADADNVHCVLVHVSPDGFRFVLDYGVDGSCWHHDLAKSRDGEMFLETLDRACAELSRVAVWPEQHME